MIIGFAGKKQSGKTTAAAWLESELCWQRRSFANPLRRMLQVFLMDCGLSMEDVAAAMRNKEAVIAPLGVSFRHLAQTLGTEWGRVCVDYDVWVKCQKNNLAAIFPELNVVFDDVRFENEADLIRSYGGKIVHIDRPDLDQDDLHASETGIVRKPGDIVLINDGDLNGLLDGVLALVDGVG